MIFRVAVAAALVGVSCPALSQEYMARQNLAHIRTAQTQQPTVSMASCPGSVVTRSAISWPSGQVIAPSLGKVTGTLAEKEEAARSLCQAQPSERDGYANPFQCSLVQSSGAVYLYYTKKAPTTGVTFTEQTNKSNFDCSAG